MGFRTGSYAKVWEVTPEDDNKTKLRVSISHKDKNDESGKTYIQDFSGFISCRGSINAKRAAALKGGNNGDRIRIGSADTTYFYNKEKEKGFTTHIVYSFYTEGDDMFGLSYKDFMTRLLNESPPSSTPKSPAKKDYSDPQPSVDDGEVEDRDLPF